MGLFSSIGKALKGISKVAGFIPGVGGTISKVTGLVGGVLDHKKPMSTTALKGGTAARLGVLASRGVGSGQTYERVGFTSPVLRSTPIMPGGAVSTPSGMVAATAVPPKSFGARATPTRKKRSSGARSFQKRRKPKRKTRLKFGSKAWQAKYNPRSKKRRKR